MSKFGISSVAACLTGVFDPQSRTDRVSQSKHGRPDAVNIVIQEMIPLPGQFIDAVHINRRDGMSSIHRQVFRFAIDLPGAGKHDYYGRIALPAGLQYFQLGRQLMSRSVSGFCMESR